MGREEMGERGRGSNWDCGYELGVSNNLSSLSVLDEKECLVHLLVKSTFSLWTTSTCQQ